MKPMELRQSTKGRHETMLRPVAKDLFKWKVAFPSHESYRDFSNHSPECIEALIVLQGFWQKSRNLFTDLGAVLLQKLPHTSTLEP